MSVEVPEVLTRLTEQFGEAVQVVPTMDQPTVTVPLEQLEAVAEYVKNTLGYVMFNDVLAADWFPSRPRFELVYQVYHPELNRRLRFKCYVSEDQHVPSMVGLWAGANWPEREAFDLFGIVFDGHPNLSRIYLPDDWEGHPLRKDYPTGGNRID